MGVDFRGFYLGFFRILGSAWGWRGDRSRNLSTVRLVVAF